MQFTKYGSIDNSYRIKTVKFIQELLPGYEYFTVQEKVHGSNFGIYTDGESVKCAKRGSFLGEESGFFGHQDMVARLELETKTKALFEYIKSKKKNVEQVSIHGEIFGGEYTHPDVERVRGVSRVQKEVKYSPNVEFLAFDIMVDGEFVDMDVFTGYCRTIDIPFLPILKIGTLEECLEYPNLFQTKVPEMYGLPEIEGNTCEGVVIKPMKTTRFGNGSRVVLKNKNEKFSEKEHVKDVQVKDPLPQHVLDMMGVAGSYVTENRLRNVLSHLGQVTQKDFAKILQCMNQDVIEDFMKENPNFTEMEKKERKEVTRFVNGKISEMIRPNFRNIIDGEF